MPGVKKNAHPLIMEMDITEKVKQYFNKLKLYDLIGDELIIGKNGEEIDESRINCWSFGLDSNQCTKDDIIQLYNAIISSRTQDLRKLGIDNKAIFYTWYDSMSGNFYFSLIPVGWKGLPEGKQLPFNCKINQITSLDCIIEDFLNDPYKGALPIKEFEVIEENQDKKTRDIDENKAEEYQLNVWSIIIP